jgi:hypothetical protein
MAQTRFIFRHRLAGAHVHVDVFAGAGPTRGKAGVLTLRPEEWDDLVLILRPHADVGFDPSPGAGSRPRTAIEQDRGNHAERMDALSPSAERALDQVQTLWPFLQPWERYKWVEQFRSQFGDDFAATVRALGGPIEHPAADHEDQF